MRLTEKEITLEIYPSTSNLLKELEQASNLCLDENCSSIRFVVTSSTSDKWKCELGVIEFDISSPRESIFTFKKRNFENTNQFNVAMLVPTGIGAEIGGHAGDAGSISRLLASTCDNLITHPNVVNSSDINEMTENTLYVEGSILTKFLMGTIALQKVRNNRLLFVIDNEKDNIFSNAAINSLNAAVATYGLDCTKIIKLDPSIGMEVRYSNSGRASGIVERLELLDKIIKENKGNFDALAISSVIKVPEGYHMSYFKSEGKMINPWGGVESILTHATSLLYNLPSAHSPMFESEKVANADPGIVDPRMAGEAVSVSFLQCILKGLQRSPKIINDKSLLNTPGLLSAKDISALVIPDGCLGLPTLAALEQGIPVIAVTGNKNIMNNDLTRLPWGNGQFHQVENYLEAAGTLNAFRAGISLDSLKRPLNCIQIEKNELIEDSKKSITFNDAPAAML